MKTPPTASLFNVPPPRTQRRAIARARQHYSLAMNAQPLGWHVIGLYAQGVQWKVGQDMTVIATVQLIRRKHWLHVSASRADRVPNYEELTHIKNKLFGPRLRAFMVFPEQKNHVNILEFCLHLFGSSQGDGLPEFSKDGMI